MSVNDGAIDGSERERFPDIEAEAEKAEAEKAAGEFVGGNVEGRRIEIDMHENITFLTSSSGDPVLTAPSSGFVIISTCLLKDMSTGSATFGGR